MDHRVKPDGDEGEVSASRPPCAGYDDESPTSVGDVSSICAFLPLIEAPAAERAAGIVIGVRVGRSFWYITRKAKAWDDIPSRNAY